jgi:hypothetical protein
MSTSHRFNCETKSSKRKQDLFFVVVLRVGKALSYDIRSIHYVAFLSYTVGLSASKPVSQINLFSS